MFQYTIDTIKTAKNYNLNERDVLFIRLVAAGADRAEAYYCIYDHGKKGAACTVDTERTKANEFIKNHPAAQVLIQKLRHQQPINTPAAQEEAREAEEERELTEEERKKLSDKSFIIKKLYEASRQVTGKEKAAVFMQIADLQRMKQETDRIEEEKRRYFLPYRSKCRSCQLYQEYKKIRDEESQ